MARLDIPITALEHIEISAWADMYEAAGTSHRRVIGPLLYDVLVDNKGAFFKYGNTTGRITGTLMISGI